jgi:VCBS repeat-containing protein
MAIFNGTHKAETINGTAQDDSIFADNGNDTINGGAGDDFIDGGNGSDLISGGAGNDVIDGGNGQDTVVYAGNRADYRVLQGQNGAVIIRDLRANGTDGQDRLFSVERVQFADGTFKLVDLIQANVAPVAQNDSLTLSETAGKTEIGSILLANDSDADGDSIVVSSVQAISAQGATVTVDKDGKVNYDAGKIFIDLDEGETATDSFTYTITDSGGLTSTATATVTITGVTPPVEMPEWDAWYYVNEDGINADEMFGSIIESFGFDIAGVDSSHALGTVLFDHDGGVLTFIADHASSDVLNFDQHQDTWFTVIGDNGKKAVIGMVINGVNDDVVAVDDALSLGEGATSANLWTSLMANDIDVDNGLPGRAILSVDTAGTQGSVVFDAVSRTLTYSAAGIDLAPGETITDTFTYTVTDRVSGSNPDTGTVTVTVTGAADGSVSASMGDSLMAAFLPAGGSGGEDLPTFDMAQAQMILGADAYIA